MARSLAANRPPVLAALLRRRAQAAAAGLSDLEAMLRHQILDSLPIQSGSAEGDRHPYQPSRAPAAGLAARRAVISTMEGLQRGWGRMAGLAPCSANAHATSPLVERQRSLALFSA